MVYDTYDFGMISIKLFCMIVWNAYFAGLGAVAMPSNLKRGHAGVVVLIESEPNGIFTPER